MHRKIKSYVVRAGRITPRQQQGLDLWLKNYALTTSDPWDFPTIFQRESEVILEIGFGMGSSLLTMAKENPDRDYVGIEVHQSGIGSLCAELYAQNITNVRVVARDGVEVIQQNINNLSLSGIQIFFPDPWHKKRHHKRRLIQPEFIQLVAKKLKPGGFIHCATDWEEYAEHILSVLSNEPLLVNQHKEGGYINRPEWRPLTKFEQRGRRLGHGVWDLFFIKV